MLNNRFLLRLNADELLSPDLVLFDDVFALFGLQLSKIMSAEICLSE